MFNADGQYFTIEGSDVNIFGSPYYRRWHPNPTTYNIYFAESKTGVEAQSQLMDKRIEWKEFISNIERLIAKRQEGEFEETEDAGSVICAPSGTMILLDADRMNAAKILIPARNNQ